MARPPRNFLSARERLDHLQGWLDSRRGRRTLGMVSLGLGAAIVLSMTTGGTANPPAATGGLTIFAKPPTHETSTRPAASRTSLTAAPRTTTSRAIPTTTVATTTVASTAALTTRSEEHTSELQSQR